MSKEMGETPETEDKDVKNDEEDASDDGGRICVSARIDDVSYRVIADSGKLLREDNTCVFRTRL